MTPVDSPEAELHAHGYRPAAPYPGSPDEPWPSRCLHCYGKRSPSLRALRDGFTCNHRNPLTAEQAVTELRIAGYEPLAPWAPHLLQGGWPVGCASCGKPTRLGLINIRGGRRCWCNHSGPPSFSRRPYEIRQRNTRHRQTAETEREEAATELKAAGFRPMEPYPGSRSARWHIACEECGKERRKVSLSSIATQGTRCPCGANRTHAEADLRDAGFIPRLPYPGRRSLPWAVRCADCGIAHTAPLTRLTRPQYTCACQKPDPEDTAREKAQEAEAELRAAGYEPLVRYPGSTSAAWLARCTTCLALRRPPLKAVRAGQRCKHTRSPRLPFLLKNTPATGNSAAPSRTDSES